MSLSKYAEKFTGKRKQISNAKWVIDGAVTYLLAGSIAYMVYSLNEGRFEHAGLLAVGGTLAMFVFISQREKKAGPVMWLLTKIFVVCWLVLEVASIAGSYMSASNGHELNQYREIKESAKNKINELREEKIDIQNSNVSPASKIYRKSEINKKIEALESEARLIIDSNEGKYFSDLSKLTGINNIGQIYQITLSALLVIAGSMLISLRNGVWCNYTLNQHLKQSAKTLEIMKSCESEKEAAIKTVSPADLEKPSAQEIKPTVKEKISGSLDATKEWLREHPIGAELSTGEMRKATGTSNKVQQNTIIKKLHEDGYLNKYKKGTSDKYSRADTKKSILNQMKSTSKFLKVVKK